MTATYTTTEEYSVAGRTGAAKFRGSDGTEWRVEVRLPGASNVMVVFHHPRTPRLNRYAWHNWRGPEARSVTARVPVSRVQDALTDADVARLFRRSMPVGTGVPVRDPYA